MNCEWHHIASHLLHADGPQMWSDLYKMYCNKFRGEIHALGKCGSGQVPRNPVSAIARTAAGSTFNTIHLWVFISLWWPPLHVLLPSIITLNLSLLLIRSLQFERERSSFIIHPLVALVRSDGLWLYADASAAPHLSSCCHGNFDYVDEFWVT